MSRDARMNLLVVMAEQFSALADPVVEGFPVDMPNLARLRSQSVRFNRAYCNAPVCGPSRLSFLSGRYACNCSGYDNGATLPPHVPTFAHMLTTAGYHTAISGRMHLHGLDQDRGFERRLASEIIDPEPTRPAIWPGAYAPIPFLPPAPDRDYAQRFVDEPIYRHDAYVTQRACEFLDDASDQTDGRPFCLVVGYFAAHSGCAPNPAHEPMYRKYLQRELPLPAFDEQAYHRLPEHMRRLLHYQQYDQRIFDREFHRHGMASYLARLEYLDQQLGRLLDALDATDLGPNTAVIFTADHGENMGRHGNWGKMNFYEEVQRVPLYLRLSARLPARTHAGRTVDQPVSLVDLLPTLAELAGCEPTFPIDGQSLMPLATNAAAEQDDVQDDALVFSEYHGYLSPSDMYMVADRRYKYCHYLREPCELYDRERDPGEVENLIDDPAYAPVRHRLEHAIRQRVDIDALAQRLHEHRRQRDATYTAFQTSPILREQIRERNHAWRRELNEPWWDGGVYLARSEGTTSPTR